MPSTIRIDSWADPDRDFDELPVRGASVSQPRKKTRRTRNPSGSKAAQTAPASASEQERAQSFQFTYQAGRYEAEWLLQSLLGFYEEHWFDDVLRIIKGGKEASVYQCLGNATTGQPHLAAKVYRPRRFRNLKKDHLYREGRGDLDSDGHEVTDDGMLHAMRKRTTYGKDLLHTSWISHEVKTMQLLKAAGADVPTAYASGGNAILMTYLGDEDQAAPTLNEVEVDGSEARALFQRILWNIELMLRSNRVHGDLSPYNVLYLDGEILLIDFPQAMLPEQNALTYRVFERDVTRICQYFQPYGHGRDPQKLARKLWTHHHHPVEAPIDPRYLDDQDPHDRALWRKLQSKK